MANPLENGFIPPEQVGITINNQQIAPEDPIVDGGNNSDFQTSRNSTIINGNSMSDARSEMPIPVQTEIVTVPEYDPYQRLDQLDKDFAAIAETGTTKGASEAHEVHLEYMYSPQLIPVLRSLHTATSDNPAANTRVRDAIQKVDSSLEEVRRRSAKRQKNLYQGFLDTDALVVDKKSHFRTNMTASEKAAVDCIRDFRSTIADPEAAKAATEVYDRFLEREIGIDMPAQFMERVMDPNTKVVMLELDFNSTLNAHETHPIPALAEQTNLTIRRAVETFKQHFPDKQIVINLNTGRPDQYIWGVTEASMGNIPEARLFGLAESGGVILTNPENGATEVAVENPEQWKSELQGVRNFITGQLANPEDLMIERKQSMLSIRVAEPKSPNFLLTTKDGQPASPEWLAQQVENYFLMTQNELGTELDRLTEDLKQKYPDAEKYIHENLNGGEQKIEPHTQAHSEKKDRKTQVLRTIHEVFNIAETDILKRLDEIDSRLDTIDVMHGQGLLQSKYNFTAGYVDIAHVDLNKYSSSVRYMCKLAGIQPDQIAWAIIGDSTTDIVPEIKTGKGEPNEDADKAMMFGVKKSNPNMQAALERRGEYGMTLKNDSVLAVISVMKGLTRALEPTAFDPEEDDIEQ